MKNGLKMRSFVSVGLIKKIYFSEPHPQTKDFIMFNLLFISLLACSDSTNETKTEAKKVEPVKEQVKEVKNTTATKKETTVDPAVESKATKAPDRFDVHFKTSKGDVLLEVHREWSPNGADRFYELVKSGYFTEIAFFRAIGNFMVQFGIHGDPSVSVQWT